MIRWKLLITAGLEEGKNVEDEHIREGGEGKWCRGRGGGRRRRSSHVLVCGGVSYFCVERIDGCE
jgi:hypothetical protein